MDGRWSLVLAVLSVGFPAVSYAGGQTPAPTPAPTPTPVETAAPGCCLASGGVPGPPGAVAQLKCCGNKLVICVNPAGCLGLHYPCPDPESPDSYQWIIDCAAIHELEHSDSCYDSFGHVLDCTVAGSGWCWGPKDESPADRSEEECAALIKHLQCLAERRQHCQSDECRRDIDNEICRALEGGNGSWYNCDEWQGGQWPPSGVQCTQPTITPTQTPAPTPAK